MKSGARYAILAVGLVLVLVLTLAAFGLDIGRSLGLIVQGAFGDKAGLSRTFVKAVPLCLCGLGMVIAWRAKMYNIGGEGQYLVGALLGATVAKVGLAWPPALLNVSVLLAGVLGGSLYASLAGWLQVKRGVQVVISTILLNFVAFQALDYLVRGPLQESKKALPLTDRLPNEAMLQRFDAQTDLHSGVFIALIAVVAIYFWLYRTRSGFALRFTGENAQAARANGLPVARVQMGAMAISGGLCGLAGVIDYAGVTGQIGNGFSQDWGFLAIPVALLGALHPFGVLFSAVYFAALFAGTEVLARYTAVGNTVVYVVQAVAVLAFLGLGWFANRPLQRRPA